MCFDYDAGKGTCRVTWRDVRDRTRKFDPVGAELLDEADPGDCPLFVSYYQYGELIGDQHDMYFPMKDGSMLSLRDKDIPDIMKKELGYGEKTSPLCMGLEKTSEIYIYLPNSKKTLHARLFRPGSVFPYRTIMNINSDKTYAASTVMLIRSGVRTLFSLPGMGAMNHFDHLEYMFGVDRTYAKDYQNHFEIFQQLTQSQEIKCDWLASVIFFSEEWVKNLHTNPKWLKYKEHIQQKTLLTIEYSRNLQDYEAGFTEIFSTFKEPPDAFQYNLIKHMMGIAAGQVAGFAPAIDDEACPANFITSILMRFYPSNKIPTLMIPAYFNIDNGIPVYCSLENLWHTSLLRGSADSISNAAKLRRFYRLQEQFFLGLRNGPMLSETILGNVARKVQFNVFHNAKSLGDMIRDAAEIPQIDSRFLYTSPDVELLRQLEFAKGAPFFKGCIQVIGENSA
jgi:hypothetical protein